MHGVPALRLFFRVPVQNAPKNPVLGQLQKNLMVELDERRRALVAGGKRLFDFGLGDPKEPTPAFVKDALRAAVPEVSQYPSAFGSPALRRAAAGYLRRRFAVTVDPETQVLACAGAKEAIFHLPLAFAGDPRRRKVVIPDPGYPTYEVGARLAGLEPVLVPLTARRRFLLDPEDVGEEILRETLVFWVSYPHNPTGAVAPRDYLRRVGDAARRYGFIVASDECYADIYFGAPPASMLEVQVENVLAIHSCSKRSGMTGYRSGFIAGDPDLVATLRKLRSHPGVGSPEFVGPAAVGGVERGRARRGAARDLPAEAGPVPALLRRARPRGGRLRGDAVPVGEGPRGRDVRELRPAAARGGDRRRAGDRLRRGRGVRAGRAGADARRVRGGGAGVGPGAEPGS